jgi:hypothetical protein
MKDTDMKSNSVNIDVKELFELTSLFRALTPDDRDSFKRMMNSFIIGYKKEGEPTNRTARIYQFTKAA